MRVINEQTAEMNLPHACLTCEGPLELRISPDGARAFCATCHTISRPRVHREADRRGFSLDYRDIARA